MPENDLEPGAGAALPRWAAIVLVLIVVGLVYVAYMQSHNRDLLSAQLNKQRERLEARIATLEDQYATLQGQFEVTSERLGLTQKELERARVLSDQIRGEQQRALAALDTLRAKQETEFGSLSGEVTNVKGDVEATRRALADTQTKLERVIGDLGEQSGLIASNASELAELKRRGERDYFEFDVQRSRDFTRIGSVNLRLNKTDTKRQKYTLTVLVSDQTIEKKDKTLLEPVQMRLPDTRQLLEIVVFEISRDRITGYLSAPKELAAAR